MNDVALAIVGGALRSYLLDKGELPDEPLIALTPISIRPTQTQLASVGAAPTAEASRGGNSSDMTAIGLATDVIDPFERVRRIARTTAKVKEQGAQSVGTLTDLAQALPGASPVRCSGRSCARSTAPVVRSVRTPS